MCHTGTFAVTSARSVITATAPCCTAVSIKSCPSTWAPFSQIKSVPGTTSRLSWVIAVTAICPLPVIVPPTNAANSFNVFINYAPRLICCGAFLKSLFYQKPFYILSPKRRTDKKFFSKKVSNHKISCRADICFATVPYLLALIYAV